MSPLERLRKLEADDKARAQGTYVPPAAPPGPGQPGQPAPAAPPKKKGGIIAAIVAVIVGILAKGKGLILLILSMGKSVFMLLKLKMFFSMFISAWVYMHFYGWPLAIGIVVMILIHELGHGLAGFLLKRSVGGILFVPFMGAHIGFNDHARNSWEDSLVSMAGPLAGTLFGLLTLGAVFLIFTDGYWHGMLIALAWFTFYINFLNLIPLFGLDGSFMCRPFRSWFWFPICIGLGLAHWACLEWLEHSSGMTVLMLLVCLGFGGYTLWKERRGNRPTRLVDRLNTPAVVYHAEGEVQDWQRYAALAIMLGLMVSLVFLSSYSELLRAGQNIPTQ